MILHGVVPDVATIDTTPPSEYLHQEPTPAERALAEACGEHSGASVAWWRFAKVALRQYAQALWISTMDSRMTRAQRYVLAAVSAAAVNLSAAGIWYIHRVEANAVATARAAELERRLDQYRDASEREIAELRLDVRELRAVLRRISGSDPLPNSGPDWPGPDKFSQLLAPKGPSTCALPTLDHAIRCQPLL